MRCFPVVVFVVACLVGASDAYATEAPPASITVEAQAPPAAVGVEGLATVPISRTASAPEANATYRQALAAAVADGLEKAEFLASKTGSKVGSIQQISEDGGSIECIVYAEVGPERDYEQYEGAQPDFGSVVVRYDDSVAERAAAPRDAVSPAVRKQHKKKHEAKAKKATATSGCTLSTQIVLSYLLT
jgi:Protein of unknown function (DUF541)